MFQSAGSVGADTLETLTYTRPPAAGGATVNQQYVLIRNADPDIVLPVPVATLLLLVGGSGRLGAFTSSGGTDKINLNATNVLARTRHHFASGGRISSSNPLGRFNVAVMDAASDFYNKSVFPKGLRGQRTSAAYTEDLKRVIHRLRAQFAGLPVWVIGTSRGSTGAAQAAAGILPVSKRPDGIVLTSSVTVASSGGNSLADVALETIQVPVLIVDHNSDKCSVTPPSNTVPLIYNRLIQAPIREVMSFNGANPRVSDHCKALSPHGFFGIEHTVVSAIAGWIKARLL